MPAEDLLDRDPLDVLGAAVMHWQLARSRPPGVAAVRATSPTAEEHGWASPHTVVQVATDDMSFLVDSVTAELTRQHRGIHLVVHPVMRVRRDAQGRLLEMVDAAERPTAEATSAAVTPDGLPDALSDGDEIVESWMHLEIDRDSDVADLERIEAALQRVLHDVREAVEDWRPMRDTARRLADRLGEHPPAGLPEDDVTEARELLRWLTDDHFTFVGYREYRLVEEDGRAALADVPGTGLGVLRTDDPHESGLRALSDAVRERAREKQLLILSKANSRSTVHRNSYLDYVGVKVFDETGEVVGEHRFLGLFTSATYGERVRRIPVVRRKVAEVLGRSGFPASSHSGKDMLAILESYPRTELFQMSVDELLPVVRTVLHLQERRQVRLFLRRDAYGRFVSALVYLPRDRYTTGVRQRMEQLLQQAFDADSVDHAASVSESVLARLHFVVRVPAGRQVPDVDPGELEARIAAATRSWEDVFAEALRAQAGEEEAARLLRLYPHAFPAAYEEEFAPRTGVADLRRVDALAPGALDMALYTPPASPGARRFKLFRSAPVSLVDVLPVLQHMGVEVVDERPYEITRADGTRSYVYDFGLRYEPAGQLTAPGVRERFQEAFAAVWSGAAESDGFNALVLRAGLHWRQAVVLRAYAKYLRQAGSTFSQTYIAQALAANAGIAARLVALFEARFDPAADDGRAETVERLGREVLARLEEVASLDEDRILRAFLTVVRATLRTNYYQPAADGSVKAHVSFKLDPQALPELPQPRPRFEIWVYAPRVEGVHLRFGPVARGGLRWSDRREDFRTEVLGLVKAQTVKNAVIVPTGAKGGFVVKRPADPADRDAVLAEGKACYRTFISGLLDVTDNLVANAVVPPPAVVRHDGDDAYLVVAADKGTATFSDLANSIAAEYGFWLGDAFASGGSVGYDHKAMGITARGAWESVKRHFREMGRDTQTEDFTCVGIGDMSGDVFGNGMLLSEHIRLVAAFDHRHVFLDPDPDPATSHAERRRLFELPRSSWADYDPALISEGGGVHPRTAKAVPITEQVRAALAIPEGVATLTPAELIRAALTAPVDLLWNGGIGTYVKATTESGADVGDKANDPVRVDGADLRCLVVGEGGNLGLTQLGRIEYARAGGRVNTDAIDNSAGVDTSDHEVNIKVLLDRVVRDGDLTVKQRNTLLAEMTDEVARLVLRDNYEQNVLLGNARMQAASMLPVHRRYIADLERRGRLDRALEFLPGDAELEQRESAGQGLTSPEFSVLLSYAKNTGKAAVLASGLPDEPWYARALRDYFPAQIEERFADRLDEHPLRREIITTCVVNDLVNSAGITFAYRAGQEVGAGLPEVARAYTVAREVFGFARYLQAIEALDSQVSTSAQSALRLEGRRLVDRSVRWLLQTRRSALDVAGEIARFAPTVSALAPQVPQLLVGAERERLHRRAAEFVDLGVPADLALQAAGLLDAFSLLDVGEVAERTGRPAQEVAELYYAVSEWLGLDRMLSRITELPRGGHWQNLARSALRYDLYVALADLTADVVTSTPPDSPPADRIRTWEQRNAEGLTRTRTLLDEVLASEAADLATLSVALRVLRTLLRS